MILFNKNPFFLKYFLPVFFIIFIIIGISGIAFYISLTEINKLIEVSNIQILNDVRSSLDERFRQVGSSIFALSEDSEIDEYLKSSRVTGNQSYYINDKLGLKFKNLVNYLNYLDNIFLFVKDKNQVISNTGPYDWDKFTNIRLISHGDLSDLEKFDFQYMTFDRIEYWDNNLDKIKESLSMNITLPLMDVNSPQALAVMVISPALFKGFFDEKSLLNEGSLFIVNRDGRILYQKGKINSFPYNQKETNNFILQTEGGSIFITDKNNMIISVAASSFNDLFYFSIIPEKVFFDIAYYLRLVIISFVAFSLVAGLLYSLFFAWQKSVPLSRMYNNLLTDNSQSSIRSRGSMGTGLPDMERRVDELNLTVKLYQPVIRENMVRKLLFGSNLAERELDKVGILFSHDYFCVFIIRNSLNHIYSIHMESMIVGFIEDQLSAYSFEPVLGINEVYILCCIKNNQEGEYQRLIQKLNNVLRRIEKNINREFLISLGAIHKGLAGISLSFKEAQKAADIGRYRLDNDVIDYGSLQRSNQKIIYPMDLERKLAQALSAGDRSKARETLGGILAQSFSGKHISVENGQFLFYEIINTTIKTIKRLQEDEGIVFPNDFLPERILKETHSIIDMKSQMYLIIDRICELVESGDRQHRQEDARKFHLYLEEHYRDPNLDLERISFDFKYSPSYFSVYFMKVMDEKFKQHLTKFRISKAMEFMDSGETSIDVILHQVGYTNYMSFNRNFKKIYHITPRAYLSKREET